MLRNIFSPPLASAPRSSRPGRKMEVAGMRCCSTACSACRWARQGGAATYHHRHSETADGMVWGSSSEFGNQLLLTVHDWMHRGATLTWEHTSCCSNLDLSSHTAPALLLKTRHTTPPTSPLVRVYSNGWKGAKSLAHILALAPAAVTRPKYLTTAAWASLAAAAT
jgi:hypothetical protein